MGCVASVRGALEKLPGVATIEIEAGRKPFTVHYDQGKVTKDQMLTALRQAGEGAKLK